MDMEMQQKFPENTGDPLPREDLLSVESNVLDSCFVSRLSEIGASAFSGLLFLLAQQLLQILFRPGVQ